MAYTWGLTPMGKTATIKLDEMPAGVPNPPPWQVLYHNDSENRNTVPEAHTDGLIKLGVPEILIRLAPPGIAAAILDRLGIYLIFQKGTLSEGEGVVIDNVEYTVVPTVKDGKPTYRLAWQRDPDTKSTKDFQMAMDLFKLKGA